MRSWYICRWRSCECLPPDCTASFGRLCCGQSVFLSSLFSHCKLYILLATARHNVREPQLSGSRGVVCGIIVPQSSAGLYCLLQTCTPVPPLAMASAVFLGAPRTGPRFVSILPALCRRAAVARALQLCPRPAFVPEAHAHEALRDSPVHLRSQGFNVSAPHMHATCLGALDLQPGHQWAPRSTPGSPVSRNRHARGLTLPTTNCGGQRALEQQAGAGAFPAPKLRCHHGQSSWLAQPWANQAAHKSPRYLGSNGDTPMLQHSRVAALGVGNPNAMAP